jgi:hypothetical protein
VSGGEKPESRNDVDAILRRKLHTLRALTNNSFPATLEMSDVIRHTGCMTNTEETKMNTSATLYDYQTGEAIRPATVEELAASIEAAKNDSGDGVIKIDGVTCYVQ